MRILALETSSLTGSVAALDGERLLGETPFDPALRTAQSFAPAMERQLQAVGWQPRDVQLIAVTHGPGSFTGLRVGVTAAKTLAYAIGAEVMGINTLAAIAAQAPDDPTAICAVIDAQRGDLFVGRFRRLADGGIEPLAEPAILAAADWRATLAADEFLIGPGLKKLADLLSGVRLAPRECWDPRAATVGRLAFAAHQAGRRDDLWRLSPLYFRKSAAEEKWDARDVASR